MLYCRMFVRCMRTCIIPFSCCHSLINIITEQKGLFVIFVKKSWLFRIFVCAVLSFGERSTCLSLFSFPERILLQKAKQVFYINYLLTQTRHPSNDGRFQSPFPDDSWCLEVVDTLHSVVPYQPWPETAETPDSQSEVAFVKAERSNLLPFLLKCLQGIFSV